MHNTDLKFVKIKILNWRLSW